MATNINMLQQLNEFEGLSQLVSRFSDAMRARLWEKLEEGYMGWSDTDNSEFVQKTQEKLFRSIEKYKAGETKQLVDIANLAAILWLRHLPNACVLT